MAAKTAEEKAAAKAAAEAKAAEAKQAADEKAKAEAAAAEAAKPAEPEVSEDTEPVKVFAGQHRVSERWSVQTSDRTAEVKPLGWVGEGFKVPASQIKELAELLATVENLPEA